MPSVVAILAELETGKLVPYRPFAEIAAFDLLSDMIGLPLFALEMSAQEFSTQFPAGHMPDAASAALHNDPVRYNSWRRIILDCYMLAAPGDTDLNPWTSLRRAARLSAGATAASKLYNVACRLPNGCKPNSITRTLATEINLNLKGDQRISFRSGIRLLDRLRSCELCNATGLLPDQSIGNLPTEFDHEHFAPLPRSLADVVKLQTRTVANAAAFVWRLAVESEQFEIGQDPGLQGLVDKLPTLETTDPASYGMRGNESTKKNYIRILRKLLVANGAVVTPYVKRETVESPQSTGDTIQRKKSPLDRDRQTTVSKNRSCGKPKEKDDWKKLLGAARQRGLRQIDVRPLRTLATYAKAEGLSPTDITIEWISGARSTARQQDRTFLSRSTSVIEYMMSLDETRALLPSDFKLEPLKDRRRRSERLPKPLLYELEEFLSFQGLKESSRRQARVAVSTLFEVSKIAPKLQEVLSVNFETVDWREHSDRSAEYAKLIRRLSALYNLPWNDKWRALQRAIVKAEVPTRENPVGFLLMYAGELNPYELDAPWARRIDRQLRSSIENPPYGRADLALTFARNIERLNALHRVSSLRDLGLLPEFIGTFRDKR
ncbi:hypothetical protein [Roseovarius sp. THAF27]|uniref:hypothetical protein n=1 Tax=Roseovarius sp. THAF27 TaxID=2587850 RepID=UPI001267BCB4|nr:hypothetical protein [Roseovarius sp. THAF27]